MKKAGRKEGGRRKKGGRKEEERRKKGGKIIGDKERRGRERWMCQTARCHAKC